MPTCHRFCSSQAMPLPHLRFFVMSAADAMASSSRLARKRLSRRAPIAYRPRRDGSVGRMPHAHRCRRYRENGRGHRRAADRSRPRGRGVESHAGQSQGGRRRHRSPRRRRSSRSARKPSSPSSPTPRALDAVYNGTVGPHQRRALRGKLFIEMSTVLPATEIALAERSAPRAPPLSNARSAARPARRGKASSSGSWAPTTPTPRGRGRSSNNCAGGSNMPGRSGAARSSNSPSTCR